ncbi:MAG TPA: c-type cytochrome [Methylophilaceae bacterium]|nr:c-type cytochrome [Methylophilaceae bacterium]
MRTLLRPLSICLLIAALPNAQAQQGQPGETKSPSAEQLLQVEVGQTRIPHTAGQADVRNPYAGDSNAVAQGRMLFDAMNCSGCHAAQGGGGMGPPLSDNVWIYGNDPAQIYLTILQGRPNGMPSFAKALPPNAIWQLVSYVETLSKSPGSPVNKPENAQQSGK